MLVRHVLLALMCATAVSASQKYKWIGASAGNDAWCNSNCNHVPPYCPVSNCQKISSGTPTPPPTSGLAACAPCTSYAFMQEGNTKFCQDSNGKCWSSSDCTGVGSLCTTQGGTPKCDSSAAAKAASSSNKPVNGMRCTCGSVGSTSYEWIGASAGDDTWCNSNCNHNPPNCPASSCKKISAKDCYGIPFYDGSCSADSSTWAQKGKTAAARGCAWVAQQPRSRCDIKGSKEYAYTACKASCYGCMGKCSTDATTCQCPSGPVNAYCTSDTQCPAEGSYCMNDKTKVAPYVCHVPNKKLQMSVTLHGVKENKFGAAQQVLFKRAVYYGMSKYIGTTQPIQVTKVEALKPQSGGYRRRRRAGSSNTRRRRRRSDSSSPAPAPAPSSPSGGNSTRRAQAVSMIEEEDFAPMRRVQKGCTSHPPVGQSAWSNCFGLSVKVQCEQATGSPYWCVWDYQAPKALPICKPCKEYALFQVGNSMYCQDSNDKCWSSVDCTGAGSLCQVGKPAAVPTCCASLCSNTTAPTGPALLPSGKGTNGTNGTNASLPVGTSNKSVTVTFNIDLSNAAPTLYNAASATLNEHFAANYSRRGSDAFVTTAQTMASVQGVDFPVTGVTVDSSSQDYNQYCADGGTGCKSSSSDSSNDSHTNLVIVLVVCSVFIVCVGIIGGGYMFKVHNDKKEDSKKSTDPDETVKV